MSSSTWLTLNIRQLQTQGRSPTVATNGPAAVTVWLYPDLNCQVVLIQSHGNLMPLLHGWVLVSEHFKVKGAILMQNLNGTLKTQFIRLRLVLPAYGSKAARREKSAWNVPTSPSLKQSPFPNHPSYRPGSFTQLEIYSWSTHTIIFPFLGHQETCAGNCWKFLKL